MSPLEVIKSLIDGTPECWREAVERLDTRPAQVSLDALSRRAARISAYLWYRNNDYHHEEALRRADLVRSAVRKALDFTKPEWMKPKFVSIKETQHEL